MTRRFSVLSIRRALNHLEAAGWQYDQDATARALIAGGLSRSSVSFVGQYLLDAASIMPQDAAPVCQACKRELDAGRSDRRYCSPRCRQLAYRKRVTARPEPKTPTHNSPASGDASPANEQGQSSQAHAS